MSEVDEGSARKVIVGRVAGVYGVRGWVKVLSYTEPPEQILDFQPWLVGDGATWRSMSMTAGRVHGKGLVAQLATIQDRDVAATLVGAEIAVRREQLPALARDEYYWTDLEGLQVVTTEGIELGVVDHFFETGANDVMVVQGERQRLIPYVRDDVVRAVDLVHGRLVVDWDPEF